MAAGVSGRVGAARARVTQAGARVTQAGAHVDEHVADRPVGTSAELTAPRERTSSEPSRVKRAGRFRWMVAGLLAFGIASLLAAVILSFSGGRVSGGGSSWSTWQPADGGLAGAQEIADFVSPYYRASPANQLAVVTAVNLNNGASPLQVAVPASGSSASGSGGGLLPLPSSSTILYNLCGVGSHDCSIGVGAPSSSRLLLLRREALELALYSFKYLPGIQSVVAILPPGHTVQGCTGICAKPREKLTTKPVDIALAFGRSELEPWLGHPLRTTLPELIPPTVSQMSNAPEAELVSIITAHGLFSEHAEQAQDGSTVLALSPMPPQ